LIEADARIPSGIEVKFGKDRAGCQRTVALAETADDIEALQSETGRINLSVTACAPGVGPVLLELFAEGFCAARVGINGGHAGGWRGNVFAQ
jgi:hypothetical protein